MDNRVGAAGRSGPPVPGGVGVSEGRGLRSLNPALAMPGFAPGPPKDATPMQSPPQRCLHSKPQLCGGLRGLRGRPRSLVDKAGWKSGAINSAGASGFGNDTACDFPPAGQMEGR